MTRSIFPTLALCLFLLLAGCREDALISSTDLQFLQHGIIVNYSTADYVHHTEVGDTLYINQGQNILFKSSYALNGQVISMDSAINLYEAHYWIIAEDTINATAFEYDFDSVGYYSCFLNTIDYAGDTLKDTVHIFVGTPLEISLVTPPLQSNVEPLSDDYIELNWEISGIDPWENSSCAVYAAVSEGIAISKETHWIDILDSVNSLSVNDCKSGMRLKGPLISQKWLQKYGIDLKDSSLSVYWGVKATTLTENGFKETASDVSVFNTLFLEGDSSILQLKPVYENLVTGTKISSQIILIDALGDTLKRINYDTPKESLNIKVKPQNGIQIYAYETKQTDYEARPITIDVPKRTKIRLTDSLVFTDKVPPKATPIKTSLALTDSIQFYFMDNGSGISPTQKKYIIADYDTINVNYSASVLSFPNPCHRECNIKIPISDNARNRNGDLFWTLKLGRDSMFITGPFAPKEEVTWRY